MLFGCGEDMRKRFRGKWEEIEWWLGVWMILTLIGSSVRLVQNYWLPNVSASYAIESAAYVPTRIMIAKIKLISDLVPQPIVDKDWLIADTQVNYLVGSGNLDNGNMVLYAHRKPSLFGRLHELKKGDFVTVTGSKDKVAYYEVVESYTTTAKDLDILENMQESVLTLFTCDGWNDSKRWVVRAKKVNDQVDSEEYLVI